MPSIVSSAARIRGKSLVAAISAALCAGVAVPVALAVVPTAPALDASAQVVNPGERVRYTIVLKGEPLATYRGGVAGYAAAARFASGRRAGRLDVHAPASRAYAEYLAARQQAFVADFATAIGRPIDTVATMQHALNAVVVEIDANEAAIAARRADVEIVHREEMRKLLTDRSPAFIGATSIWDGTASGGVETQGEGVLVGDLDTGINWESPAFAATGPLDGYVYVNPLGAGTYIGLCGPNPPNADLGHCNDKLIGMYDFTSSSASRSANDTIGHGSHTASTIVGNHWEAPFGGGTFTISGIAPHATIIAYKVCTASGCSTSSSSQAVNQAVIDGVDVINFSISGGVAPWSDPVSVAFRGAVDAGVFVAASAGNDGPVAGSSNHIEPWVETVAASTKDNVAAFRFNLIGPGTPPPETQNRPLRPAAPPLPTQDYVNVPIVQSPNFDDGSNDGCSAYPPDTFTAAAPAPADRVFADGFDPASEPARVPAIAVLHLDGNASNCGSVARREAALDAGAIGVIFVDTVFLNLGASDSSWAMLRSDWDAVAAAIASDPAAATASLLFPAASFPQLGDVVADFSSRGPVASNGQYLVKPDITAPGVDILAAYASNFGGGATATALDNGTSMSSPHIAASAVLLRGVNPTWTPTQIRSAINMTSKLDGLSRPDGTPINAFDLGSGRVDLTHAALSGLVLDETTANFIAANPSSGGDVSTLNLASFASADCATTCSFTRTVTSTTLTDQTYTLTTSGPAGAIAVSPPSFTISAGASQVITVTVDGTVLAAGWNFGAVALEPNDVLSPPLHMPVAIRH
jgi:subtilase family protein/fibronectin type III domain protein